MDVNFQHPLMLGDALLPISRYLSTQDILNCRLVCKGWLDDLTHKFAVQLLIKSLPSLLKNCKNWDGYYLYNGKAKDVEFAVSLSHEHFLTALFLKALCANDNELKKCEGFSESIQKIGCDIRQGMNRGYVDLKEIDNIYQSFYFFYNSRDINKKRRVSHMKPPEEMAKINTLHGKFLLLADSIATVALHRLYYNQEQLEYSLKQTGKKILGTAAVIVGVPLTLITCPLGLFGGFISFCRSFEGGLFGGGGGKSVLGEVLTAPTRLGLMMTDTGEKELEKANLSLIAPSKKRHELIEEIEQTFPNAKHTLAID